MSNDSNSLCNISKSISSRSELQIMYFLECIFGLLALFPNLLTLNLLWHVKIFHANLRLIFANLTCNMIFYSLAISIKAFLRLIGNVCDFPTSMQWCAIKELAPLIPLHNTLMSLVILSLERLYATLKYRSYDFAKSIPYLGMFLIACAWTTTLALDVPNVFTAPIDMWIPICDSPLVSSTGASQTVTILFIFETIAVGITTFAFFYNRYISKHMTINRAVYDLSARFQVDQNVQLNKALMPGIILHVICFLPSYAFLVAIFVWGGSMEISTKAWILHMTYVWRLGYALVDPILLITLNPNFRQGLEKSSIGKLFLSIFHRIWKRNSIRTTDVTRGEAGKVMAAHFDYLQQMWSTQKQPSLKSKK